MRSVTHFSRERLVFPAFVWALLTLASGHSTARAEQLKSPPVGVRVFYTGHSFHVFVPRYIAQMAEAARIENHQQVGILGLSIRPPGSSIITSTSG